MCSQSSRCNSTIKFKLVRTATAQKSQWINSYRLGPYNGRGTSSVGSSNDDGKAKTMRVSDTEEEGALEDGHGAKHARRNLHEYSSTCRMHLSELHNTRIAKRASSLLAPVLRLKDGSELFCVGVGDHRSPSELGRQNRNNLQKQAL